MQKYFCFMLLAMVSVIASINCMDDKISTAIKKHITIELHLSEVKSQNCIELEGFNSINQRNKHRCSVLGIEWREGDSEYFVNRTLFKHSECLNTCWTEIYSKILPLPICFPALFVKQLQQNKDKSVTLEPKVFQTPITIIFKLGSIKRIASDIKTNEEEIDKQTLEKLDRREQLKQSFITLSILGIGAGIIVILVHLLDYIY